MAKEPSKTTAKKKKAVKKTTKKAARKTAKKTAKKTAVKNSAKRTSNSKAAKQPSPQTRSARPDRPSEPPAEQEELLPLKLRLSLNPKHKRVADPREAETREDLINAQFAKAVQTFVQRMIALLNYADSVETIADETASSLIDGFLDTLGAIVSDASAFYDTHTPIGFLHVVHDEHEEEEIRRIPIFDSQHFKAIEEFVTHRQTAQEILYDGVVQQMCIHFESLLGDMLACRYRASPSAIPKDSSIRHSDLLTFDSLDQAKEHAIAMEVDRFARERTEKQLDLVERHIGIDLAAALPFYHDATEALLRRHAIVHNQGRVSREYCERTSDLSCAAHRRADVGAAFASDHAYVNDAWASLFALGVWLCERCWRKALPKGADAKELEAAINLASYSCLEHDRHTAAVRLLEQVVKLGWDQGIYGCMARINLAIAYKSIGRVEESMQLVTESAWQTAIAPFRLAAAAVREDYVTFEQLLPLAAKDGDLLDVWSMYRWPVFKWVRSHKDFDAAVETAFGKLPALREVRVNSAMRRVLKNPASAPPDS